MNVKCEQIDDLLLDGGRFSLETAAAHAAECPKCMETLTAWNEISETAASLKTTWQNDLLWPRIDRALREEKRKAAQWQLWRIAAVVLLTFGLAGSIWFVSRSNKRDFDEAILRTSALDEVRRAENAHLAAIKQLERVAESKLETSSAPIMVSYKEKLILLDDAIAECETQIERNRGNAHLRKQLLTMYSEKQRTLEDVLREGTHVSNQ